MIHPQHLVKKLKIQTKDILVANKNRCLYFVLTNVKYEA